MKPEIIINETPVSAEVTPVEALTPAQGEKETTATPVTPETPVRSRRRLPRPDPAVEETLRLYHAWLGYLLTRLGEAEIRVPVADLTRALQELSCCVSREGDAYLIRPVRREEAPASVTPDEASALTPTQGGECL